MIKWEIAKGTIKGKSHELSKKPNQDSMALSSENHICESPLISVVSDGHGSDKYFRSDLGSHLAVHTSISYIKLLISNFEKAKSPYSEIKDYCIEKLPGKLISFWKRAVKESIKKYPYKETIEDIYVPYGSTLLCTFIYSNILIILQLGDGDILIIDSDYGVEKVFGKDPDLIANETYSLCMQKPERFFKVDVRRIDHNPPELIMISTDGYSNSFKDDDAFYKAGKDYLATIQTEGIQVVRDNLAQWLKETSDDGSGDDTSLILLHRFK
ncbi:MAG: protein phosphatase 2C domain-containing protein [Leptospiraceae bacterium]|nr:protein phosphatase 2C domain-containing protein [Leptospiraceae bacterium]